MDPSSVALPSPGGSGGGGGEAWRRACADHESLISGAKCRKGRWCCESEPGSVGGAWGAEPQGSWQEQEEWVEGLNNYVYSILSSDAFTLGWLME